MCGLVVSLHRESYFVCLMLDKNQLGIEKTCAFAIPGNWTLHNKYCYEDGRNCMDQEIY